jgi:glycosyltransferase involved in cell wall biosynthesis
MLSSTYADQIGIALYEADHVARALAQIDDDAGFDVVHDHCGFTTVAMADRISVPVVHTVHGAFTAHTGPFYARHGSNVELVGISRAQVDAAPSDVAVSAIVPNPVDARNWPYREDRGDYLLFVGRMDPVKGPHRAIRIAARADVPLVLAGPVQPGQEQYFHTEVAPHVDGQRVRYVGEVGGPAKQHLFAASRALLMPIRWAEPFGLVMIEALAAGTPVVAFAEGAAPEIVRHGVTGFLGDDEAELADAIPRLASLDPRACRADALERFDPAVVAAGYEQVYRRAMRRRPPRPLLDDPKVAPVAALLR